MRVMVTGAAGFIGTHLSRALLNAGADVIRIDSFTDYYSPALKRARQEALEAGTEQPLILEVDLTKPLHRGLGDHDPIDAIIHLAAQPGVRLPVAHFGRYVQANILALSNVFDFAATLGIPHVLYASSSSVYGDTTSLPFCEAALDLDPSSFYGSSKLAGELLASGYCQSGAVSARGMRYFTVYGPWGRPDMAYFRLIASALGEWRFTLTGSPTIRRDFTFVEDTISSTIALLEDLLTRPAGHHDVVNVGGGNSRTMGELIEAVAALTGAPLSIEQGDPIAADMAATEADFGYLEAVTGQRPRVPLEVGLERCLAWASREDVKPKLRAWIESTL